MRRGNEGPHNELEGEGRREADQPSNEGSRPNGEPPERDGPEDWSWGDIGLLDGWIWEQLSRLVGRS